MKIIRWTVLLLSASVTTLLVRADEIAQEAKIIAVQGVASVGIPGKSGNQPASVGTLLPAGSSIHTTGGALITVQFFSGTSAIVQPDTDITVEKLSTTTTGNVITKENAILNLRAGSVISSLDPSKKEINNYGVRTPRGIAAARGTVYAVNVETDGKKHSTVATMTGVVTFYTDKGDISVPFGKFFRTGDNDSKAGEYRDLVKSDPKLAAELIAAIKSIADGVAAGTIPNKPGLLQALHDAVGVIDPNGENPVIVPTTPPGTILPPLDTTIPVTSPAEGTSGPTPPPRPPT